MEKKLLLVNAAKDISSTVLSLVSTYKEIRQVKKRDLIMLKEQIRTYQASCQIKGMGEIIRANIEEISKTQRFIEQQKLSSLALEMAMTQLENLNKMLTNNLEKYTNGY